jgi:hypothetical protein
MAKTLTFLSVLLLTYTNVYSQPTLHGNEHRLQNGTYRVVSGNLFFPNPGDAGAGVTWNFRGLNGSASEENISGNVPFARFPANKKIESESVSSFYVSSDDAFSVVGAAGQQDTRYTLPIEIVRFPMQFNETNLGTFAGTVTGTLSPISFRNGDTESTYDGFGTLVLPDATYNDVYRVKVVIDIEEFPLPRTLRSTRYYWFVKGSPMPILRLTINEENLLGLYIPTGSSFKYVVSDFVNQQPLSTADVTAEEEFRLYPNPASESVRIQTSGNPEYVRIFSIQGKEVLLESVTSKDFTLNISQLPPGVYTILLNANGNEYFKKLIVSQ